MAKISTATISTVRRDWLAGLLLLVATLLAYAPAWHGTPLWDDPAHLPKPELQSWHGLWLMWTKPGVMDQYYPLAYSVLWAGHKLWGDAMPGYHLLNILLHVSSALMLVRVMRRLEVPGAWLAAFIFALHPVHVESVAWISEIKNTLSCALMFASLLLYLDFDRDRRIFRYIIAWMLFALGLMAKSVIATMPPALLVIFWWRRGKLSWRRDVLPLVPFFVTGVASGLFTAHVEKTVSGAVGKDFAFSLMERCLIAARAFWFYLGKLFWPVDVGMVYPRWTVSHSVWWQYLFVIAALALFACLWAFRKHRGPLAAMLLFAGMTFPALGFVNINYFIFSFVADHFQYPASVAVIALVSAGVTAWLGRLGGSQRMAGHAFCIAMLGVMALLSWRESRNYMDAETSYRSMIAKNPACWIAYTNLGDVLALRGNFEEALACQEKAVQIKPDHAKIQDSLGQALMMTRNPKEAVLHYLKAIELKPTFAEACNNLGNTYQALGQASNAAVQYEKAIRINPGYAQAHENYALLLLQSGDLDGAAEHYRTALGLMPGDTNALHNLGVIYFRKGRVDDAIFQYQQALKLRPDYAEAHASLGVALRAKGNMSEAVAHFEKALQLAPNHLIALNQLAWMLATSADVTLRNGPRAVELATKLNALPNGRSAMSLMTLAAAYAESGRFSEAMDAAGQALQLARVRNDNSLAAALAAQMDLYRSRQPLHESPHP